MKTQYIKSGNAYFALNFKAATSSIARAIVSAHYPDIEDNLLNNTSYPEGVSIENSRWHSQLPKTENPDSDVVLIVRDPVERFRSACAETGKTPDEALSEQGQRNMHFWPTSRLLLDGCKLYRFESDLDAAVTALGLAPPLPDIDGGNGPMPDLTPEELSRIQEVYADDITLYESITEAGQTYNAPPVPVTDEMKAAKIAELEAARWDAEVAGITLPDGKFVRTDKETQAELGKALSIISTVNPALEIDWKFPDGTVEHLDPTQIQEIAGAVFAHVQATRTAFKDKAGLVYSASTQAELDAITL